MEKKKLREKMLDERRKLTKKYVSTNSHKIIEQIKKQINIKKYNCLGFYMPFNNEVDLIPLMNELLDSGKEVVLPKVLSKTEMEFYVITDLNDVHKSSFNVLEPNSQNKKAKDEIDILFIPGLAYSLDMYRLGYGAGFYDRYLKDYHGIKVGICFDFQIHSFPNYSHDIPLDLIITESRVHPSRDEG